MYVGISGWTPLKKSSDDIQPPGGVYPDGGWMPITQNSNGSITLIDRREYCQRFELYYPHKFKQIGTACTIAGDADSVIYMGVRGMLMSGWPGPILSQSHVSALSLGSLWVSLPEIILQPGSYCISVMGTGWSAIPVRLRNFLITDTSLSMPGTQLPMLVRDYSVNLPSGGNQGFPGQWRLLNAAPTGLTEYEVRDWSIGSSGPAVYVQAEPIYEDDVYDG